MRQDQRHLQNRRFLRWYCLHKPWFEGPHAECARGPAWLGPTGHTGFERVCPLLSRPRARVPPARRPAIHSPWELPSDPQAPALQRTAGSADGGKLVVVMPRDVRKSLTRCIELVIRYAIHDKAVQTAGIDTSGKAGRMLKSMARLDGHDAT